MNIKTKGISLIVLVITIIVMIIIAGAIILSLSNANVIAKAKEAKFKYDIQTFNKELSVWLAEEYVVNGGIVDTDTIDATKDSGTYNSKKIQEIIKSMPDEYADILEIKNGKIIYVGTNSDEKDLAIELSIEVVEDIILPYAQINLNTIATVTATINGQLPSYNNPIIPVGFKAIDTATSSWSSLSTDYNKGLVIQDINENEFVWVPVDGTNVPYAKWCTMGIISYTLAADDTLPALVTSEQTQITNYKGFYVARYEASFDYNGGSIQALSKKSTNVSVANWSTTRNVSYTGYLWNYINYTQSKSYAQAMYNTATVKSGILTGTMWDTTMKWIQISGKSVTNSTTWGNYRDNSFTYDYPTAGTKPVTTNVLLNTGATSSNSSNNIYDLGGNIWEMTNETYGSYYRFVRGGSFGSLGSGNPASYREYYGNTGVDSSIGFRVALYII